VVIMRTVLFFLVYKILTGHFKLDLKIITAF
jgi:hypothetical protein